MLWLDSLLYTFTPYYLSGPLHRQYVEVRHTGHINHRGSAICSLLCHALGEHKVNEKLVLACVHQSECLLIDFVNLLWGCGLC